ncbi:MAG: sensor histidine kinase [Eisenbergiella sp.]
MVLLADEIGMARAYRYPEVAVSYKVDVVYNLAEETLKLPVAGMILQSILENVFLHSVEKTTAMTTLYLASKLEGETVLNGAG